MPKNRIYLLIVIFLTMFAKSSKCYTYRMLPRRETAGNGYSYFNSKQEQQQQANSMPVIVKNVNYNEPKSYRNAAQDNTAACVDKASCPQVIQRTHAANNDVGTCSKPSPEAGEKPPTSPAPPPPAPPPSSSSSGVASSVALSGDPNSPKLHELQKLVQQLYVAQAQVQLEATEIQRAQTIAAAAQQSLEEASNNVRVITAALHAAQEAVAANALRAQTAQLQLAAHDQLLFTARQKVDALSAQMVGLQAEEGISEHKVRVDLPALLNKLKEPLPDTLKPTPVPSIIGDSSGGSSSGTSASSSSDKTVDPRKLYETLQLWKDRVSRIPEAVVEQKAGIYESSPFEEYETDTLEENSESVMDSETQKSDSLTVNGNSKINDLSPEELQTLVDFIVSSEQKRSSQQQELAANSGPSEDSASKNADDKYINDFLSSIRNSEIPNVAFNDQKDKAGISPKMDPKISDQILNLHETLFHPVSSRHVPLPSNHDQSEIQLPEIDDQNNYISSDEAAELEELLFS